MEQNLFSYPTPFTPPTTEEDELSVLRLIRSRRVGPSTFQKLLSEYGSASAALQALPEVARAAGAQDYQICPLGVVEAELRAGRRLGAKLIVWGARDYPELLREIPDPPAVLWALGDRSLLTKLSVAIVGAREASGLAVRMTRKIAQDMGEAGLVVTSGLARGVDAAAHEGALETGTIAVQPGGIDVLYPEETADLARKIAAKGLRLSEQPPGFAPRAQSFLARNRIIAGLSRALVVTEAAARSGALNAARTASDQGREVMAVPGHPYEPRASGCNYLIRDGATLIRSARDILDTMAGAGITLPEAPSHVRAAPRVRSEAPPPEALPPEALPEPSQAQSQTGADPVAPLAPPVTFKRPPQMPPQAAAKTLPPAPQSTPALDEFEIVDWILGRLEALGAGVEIYEEEVLRDCPAPPALILQAISVLELEGMVTRGIGGRLALL